MDEQAQPESRASPEEISAGKQEWQKFGQQIRSITPAGYLRILLALGAIPVIIWLIWQGRVALLPFFIGIVIAYILLPVVNLLDRVMWRFLAVLLSLTVMFGLIALLLYALLPPFAREIPKLVSSLPDQNQLREQLNQLGQSIQALPEPTRGRVLLILQSISEKLRSNMDLYLTGFAGLIVTTLLRLLNTFGFVLGFVIVPAWLLSVLKDQRKAVRAINRALPEKVQPDFWAVVRIIDRPLRAFVSGQFLLALSVGLGVYGGLTLLERLGWPALGFKLPLALIAGLMELIPEIGPYLGAFPSVIAGTIQSPQMGLAVAAMFIILHYLINQVIGSRIETRIIEIHPAILLVVIVAVSALGFRWVLVAAPMISIVTNLFRYVNGRLSSSPRPAGLLPGESIPASQRTRAYIPLVYRRGRVARQPSGVKQS